MDTYQFKLSCRPELKSLSFQEGLCEVSLDRNCSPMQPSTTVPTGTTVLRRLTKAFKDFGFGTKLYSDATANIRFQS
eukprot:4785532-Amphidinium_carterae.1